MSLLEKVTQMGKDLGLTEDKLVAFIEKNLPIVAAQEDKDKEREERRLDRETKLEAERLSSEAEKARQENEKAMMEMKIRADQEAMELKIKAEQEAEERRLQAEEKRMQQEWEIEKLKADTSIEHSRHKSTRLELTHKPKPKILFFAKKVD